MYFPKCSDWDFPGGPEVKNPPASAGDLGSIPGPGRLHTSQGNKDCSPNYWAQEFWSPYSPRKSNPHSWQLEKALWQQQGPSRVKKRVLEALRHLFKDSIKLVSQPTNPACVLGLLVPMLVMVSLTSISVSLTLEKVSLGKCVCLLEPSLFGWDER